MRIIIVRHGETLENTRDEFMGHLPGTLSPLGIDQAKKVALRLKDEPLDYIFSSDLARSLNTALEIAKFHPNAKFSTDRLLREFDMGSWNGKTKKEVGFREGYVPKLPADSETWPQVYGRAKTFLDKNLDQSKNTLLVGHDGINRALIAALSGKGHEGIREVPRQFNTAVNVFDLVDGLYKPVVLNCKKHLE